MDWNKELKDWLGIIDEIDVAGLEDMEDYEVLKEDHLRNMKESLMEEGHSEGVYYSLTHYPTNRDISKGFFQAVREAI